MVIQGLSTNSLPIGAMVVSVSLCQNPSVLRTSTTNGSINVARHDVYDLDIETLMPIEKNIFQFNEAMDLGMSNSEGQGDEAQQPWVVIACPLFKMFTVRSGKSKEMSQSEDKKLAFCMRNNDMGSIDTKRKHTGQTSSLWLSSHV